VPPRIQSGQYLSRRKAVGRSQFILWDEDNAFQAIDYPILEGHEQNVIASGDKRAGTARRLVHGAPGGGRISDRVARTGDPAATGLDH
jgi:hypothetical protein